MNLFVGFQIEAWTWRAKHKNRSLVCISHPSTRASHTIPKLWTNCFTFADCFASFTFLFSFFYIFPFSYQFFSYWMHISCLVWKCVASGGSRYRGVIKVNGNAIKEIFRWLKVFFCVFTISHAFQIDMIDRVKSEHGCER